MKRVQLTIYLPAEAVAEIDRRKKRSRRPRSREVEFTLMDALGLTGGPEPQAA